MTCIIQLHEMSLRYHHFSALKGFLLSVPCKQTTDQHIMHPTSGILHYLEFVCLHCVCGQLNKDFSVCESESSDPYQRSNLLHHQHNTRPFKHPHPGYSRVINFGPGNILVSIKLGMFQQPIYSARVRQVCRVTSS